MSLFEAATLVQSYNTKLKECKIGIVSIWNGASLRGAPAQQRDQRGLSYEQ
jgi:hypothetical protein